MNISINFFGLARRLDICSPSINQNIINPLKKLSNGGVFAINGSFNHPKMLNNQRSKEIGIKFKCDYTLIPFDSLTIKNQEEIEISSYMQNFTKYNDFYNDNFSSHRNLLFQLFSLVDLEKVQDYENMDLFCFFRPDLIYHNELNTNKLVRSIECCDGLMPKWQSHGGLNDRIFITKSSKMAKLFLSRIHAIKSFQSILKNNFSSEQLLGFVLKNKNFKIGDIDLQASRVRMSGEVIQENFYKNILLSKFVSFISHYYR